MRHSKSVSVFVLALLAAFGLASCGKAEASSTSPKTSTSDSTSALDVTSSKDITSSSSKEDVTSSTSEEPAHQTFRFEAEDAILTTGAKIQEEAGSNASNGKHVGDLTGGNMRFTFDSDSATTGDLTITFSLADAAITSFKDYFMVMVNDEVVNPTSDTLAPSSNGWFSWYTFHIGSFSFVQGTNTVTFAALQNPSANYDYIEITSTATMTKHTFRDTDKKDYFFLGKEALLTDCAASTEKDKGVWLNEKVGDITSTSVITYHIDSEEAQSVDLACRIALVSTTDFSALFSVKVNDTDVTLSDSTVPGTASANWDSYHLMNLGTFHFIAGTNTITFTAKGQPTNFNFLRVSASKAVSIHSEETGTSYYLEAEDADHTDLTVETNASAHGGKDVGGMDSSTKSITFTFTSSAAASAACYLSYAYPAVLTSNATLTLNGTAVEIPTAFNATGGWADFQEAKLADLTLVSGQNVLVLKNCGAGFGNVDYIRLVTEATITFPVVAE